MKIPNHTDILLSLLSFLVLSISFASSDSIDDNFHRCISCQTFPIPIPIYSPKNSSYEAIFRSSARNLRFLTATSEKPRFLITALHESHVQAAVVCCRKHGLDIKIRSGGHDAEGLSYSDDTYPYVMVDLVNYRNITVNVEDKSAWIQAGAQLGEVYYRIGEKSKTLGFPAGFTATVGVGGHITGGGIGSIVRKHGLSCDQVIDARFINVDGKVLDKRSMGKDLFWAIRGGGAASFGVVLAWKVRLVPVTPIVTVAMFPKTLEQNATSLVYKWQNIAHKLPEDLFIALSISVVNATQTQGRTVQVSFWIMYLGQTDKLLQLMDENFPELGLSRKDCSEMRWVESHIFFYSRGSPLELLLDRDPINKIFLKVKTDYVKEPIPITGLEGIWKRLMEEESPSMFWHPFGGKVDEISESATPYPHRAGYMYNILYIANWLNESESARHIDWIRRIYNYTAPYVSKNPRDAYFNYKDLDLGMNKEGSPINPFTAKSWGTKYFKGNYMRLVYTKTKVDPANFFRNKQSIPPLSFKKAAEWASE